MSNHPGITFIGSSRYHFIIYSLLIAAPIILYLFGLLNDPSKKVGSSIAFFYGKPIPFKLLSQFERVVVEPDNIESIQEFKNKGVEVFAYLSVGEIHPSRIWYSTIPKDWLLGENQAWGSSVIDLSKKEWQEFLLTKLIQPLWDKGYRGFFLDTLDSYQILIKDSGKQFEQQRALVNLIQAMHGQFPGIKIILNRGFEIIPVVSKQIMGVAAESLFQRWDAAANSYVEVPAADRDWLLNKLNQIHKQTGLNIIVIDYVQPNNKSLAKTVAEKIKQLGFTPWVANPALDIIGVSSIEVNPKQALLIYDSEANKLADWQKFSLFNFFIKLLNYFDYSVEYVDARKNLPLHRLAGQYSCLLTLFKNNDLPNQRELTTWLDEQKSNGMYVINL
jgi:polysaccharide biosynthesis protein PelA